MSFIELFLIAIALSMDAFAAAVCLGLAMDKAVMRKSLIVGLYFGVFQSAMPLIGFMAATQFADKIVAYDHWIAFALLSFLGGKMILSSYKANGCKDRKCPIGLCNDRTCPGGKKPDIKEASLEFAQMLPLAVATSIDALAVGVSFAFLRVDILPAVSFIGFTTFVLSMTGVKIGNVCGARFKSKTELAGGIILVLIGINILIEHVM